MIREFCIISFITLVGVAYSLFSGLAPAPWVEPELNPGEIRVVDARTLQAIWLDARNLEAFEKAHVPDAVFFDESDWDGSLLILMERWLMEPSPIIVYCGSESCGTSRRIAEQLREMLPEAEIYSLKGGWDAWQN